MINSSIIKPFKKSGDYQVDVYLGYLESSLKGFVNDYGLEMNPDFQRGNVWTKEQQIAYVEFLLRGGTSAKIIYFNCPNFSSGCTDKENNPMVCIDGLQRITAIRKFIANELPIFGGYYLNDFSDKNVILRRNSIKININELKTRKEILEWYLDFNSGGTVHSEDELNRVRKLLLECV